MLKKDVIEFFGNVTKTAEACGITLGAVSQWGEIIPREQALLLAELTRGKGRRNRLKFDPELYNRG